MIVPVKMLKSYPARSYYAFCNALYYMGVSGPSLHIEFTDSVITHHRVISLEVLINREFDMLSIIAITTIPLGKVLGIPLLIVNYCTYSFVIIINLNF